MARRGDATRQRLLDAAERLFGERGVAGVSLREIRIASGARNTAALQFHFGDRDGLINALTQRHLPRIAEIQNRIYAEMQEADRLDDPRTQVEILVRPVAEYLTLGPSERAWVKIQAELGTQPRMRLLDMVTFAPTAALAAGNALFERLSADVPPELATERMILSAQVMVHVCAARARIIDDPDQAAAAVPDDVFLENLIDMILGGLTAPVGAATAARVRR